MTAGYGVASTSDLSDPDRHGDQDAAPGLADFAVNVRGTPPPFVLDAIMRGLGDLARYPGHDDERRAVDAIAAAHGRSPDEVLLLSGAADGFEMLPRLGVRHAALIQPSFTEPELALRAAAVPITQVTLDEPWRLDRAVVPDTADLVILGNPTNPTSVLHPREAIGALRRPGRIIVVDEAFADLTLGADGTLEPQSLASSDWPDLIVIRSVTKTFGLAGLRAGYLLAAPGIISRLRAGRRPWALSTPALAALTACLGDEGHRYCSDQARRVAAERAEMVDELTRVGLVVVAEPAAPFVLVEVPRATDVKRRLVDHGFAVRSCANFVGLGDDHLRLAVRPVEQVRALTAAIEQVREEMRDGNRVDI
ncbi:MULTISPECIES: Rv2231c family pyridoxal phosphate-dependent protein CobC [Gordonia]|uniref:Aminotransferase n=1 Tax=Gordonia amicalis TaxID=89053 RepID=A0ABU4D984_9ACTN|nr:MULTISPECIES: Rv2231c family pyridoxal phosphate-dependent protein CobC [Gordonia]ATD71474.1 aminotransferase [Gordonia sp. 1D]MCR8896475.1 Rv2231c family pyridoxal phosphate-dependent protein CobC [Gordonia sp. GONU]MDJ0452295.1 Rv2231c family pyridoxal phosphate-dependent protein CobC [Gordonia amicalis]MDV6306306.1 Rv2231c family pyridoxal phosphate-dependent protein CobC [Gordonia amicalis]MDV7074907.1 Rv2231c family pyridoxal phosphate-dependent protein CobC [Gordonia amicalis]